MELRKEGERRGRIQRETLETSILIELNLDGDGKCTVSTGVGFFDHMLTLFAKHANLTLNIKAKGDTWIDDHHTVEDVGIALGQALKQAFGDKVGIQRYGHAYVPMDETLVRTALDISGRPFLVYEVEGLSDKVGQFDCQLIEEFCRAVAFNAGLTLHIDKIRGKNSHHILEAVFKSFAQALRESARIVSDSLPSTKGVIE
ncbi:imidazoleglycerol-phosphate dehydratase HisB [Candidatus Chlorohelix sp.]|uniref:imidazoleglycerol-phosphate dehydratase HisB n=1 Tax=Candidatus Chlorohelix sp. TaxID=3139201 RepID=UPI003144D552